MSRFKAIGHFVYEKGDRIGVTLDEAAIELAQKLNAYQMRVERLKEQDRSQTESHRINTNMWKDEVARLKAEVQRLEEEKKLPFAYGGKQLLVDLNKLLTAHRYYCDVNAIDYRQMEKNALNASKEGKDQP